MEIRERYKPPAQPSIPHTSKVHTKNESPFPFLLFSIILASVVFVALALSCYLFVFKTPISSNFKLFPDRTSNPLLHHGKLEIVAELPTPPGNIAVSKDDRIFFTFHPFLKPKIKVVEWISKEKKYIPYPNENFQDAENGFDSVLSLRIDDKNRLWALDYGSDGEGQPKVFIFDLSNNELILKYNFPKGIAGAGSQLNDFVISPDSRYAFIADASMIGNNPAIIIFDSEERTSMRRLGNDTSLRAENYIPVINGSPFLPDGNLQIHVDSIGLDKQGEWLYFAACTSNYLYRIQTSDLLNEDLNDEELASKIEIYAEKTMSDGITIDAEGNIYLSDFEHSAITVLKANRFLSTLVRSEEYLRWPDGFSFDSQGNLYVTTSLVHHIISGKDLEPHRPFHILKIHPLK